MKTDSLFYRLFRQMPELLLTLAGLDVPAEGYRFGSHEIKQTAFQNRINTPFLHASGALFYARPELALERI